MSQWQREGIGRFGTRGSRERRATADGAHRAHGIAASSVAPAMRGAMEIAATQDPGHNIMQGYTI